MEKYFNWTFADKIALKHKTIKQKHEPTTKDYCTSIIFTDKSTLFRPNRHIKNGTISTLTIQDCHGCYFPWFYSLWKDSALSIPKSAGCHLFFLRYAYTTINLVLFFCLTNEMNLLQESHLLLEGNKVNGKWVWRLYHKIFFLFQRSLICTKLLHWWVKLVLRNDKSIETTNV